MANDLTYVVHSSPIRSSYPCSRLQHRPVILTTLELVANGHTSGAELNRRLLGP